MYKVLDVSRHVINYSIDKNYSISNLRLQKLLYFIQAYFLSYTEKKEPCFREEIEAWDFGPVVPEAYYNFKQYGSSNIPKIEKLMEFVKEDSVWKLKSIDYNDDCLDDEDKQVINDVVDSLSEFSALELVNITHNQSPWKDVYVPNKRGIIIKNEAIRSYFSSNEWFKTKFN